MADRAQTHDNHSDATISIPLRSINVVATHVPFIEDARAKVTAEMESMVLTGLSTLVGILQIHRGYRAQQMINGPYLGFGIESVPSCVISSDSIQPWCAP
jgi:hypothetical protein